MNALLCADVLLRNYSLTHRDDDPTALHLCPSTASPLLDDADTLFQCYIYFIFTETWDKLCMSRVLMESMFVWLTRRNIKSSTWKLVMSRTFSLLIPAMFCQPSQKFHGWVLCTL